MSGLGQPPPGDDATHDALRQARGEASPGERVVTSARTEPADNPDESSGRRRSPWGLPILVTLGVLVFLPALLSPFLLDDYLHVAMVDGTFPVPRSPFALYDFVNDADRPLLVERGILPWWSHPQLTIRFLRPLSSALLWANHRLFGAHALLLHVHSLLWWLLVVLAARALFERALPRRPALLATAIFALAPCHAIPLAWLANFEALVSLALGTFALGSYARWRDERAARSGALAAAGFTLAMLGGEYALCFGGYVLAIELFRRRESLGRRAIGVLPFALPTLAYLAVRTAGHYGTVGSGFYTDPLRNPLDFLRAAPWRLVALLADGWLTADADTWGPTAPRWAMVLIVAAGVALLWVPLRRLFAALDDDRRYVASWMLVGSVLATIPMLAVAPSPRVLGASALGTAAIVALLLDRAWFPRPDSSERRGVAELTGLVAVLLGFAHLVHGPVTSFLLGRQMRRSAVEFAEHAAWLRAKLPDAARADVVIVRGWGGTFFGPFSLDEHARPPKRWRILSQSGHVLVLRRDARTLELVAPEDRNLTSTGPGNLFRNPREPLRVGDEVTVPGMRATVLESGADGPRRVRFVFDRDIDDPDVTWIAEGVTGFRDAQPPQPGFGAPLEP